MADTDLLTRLREVARRETSNDGTVGPLRFRPEQVARGLERMRETDGCGNHSDQGEQDWQARDGCDACWAAMLDAFLEGCKDG